MSDKVKKLQITFVAGMANLVSKGLGTFKASPQCGHTLLWQWGLQQFEVCEGFIKLLKILNKHLMRKQWGANCQMLLGGTEKEWFLGVN